MSRLIHLDTKQQNDLTMVSFFSLMRVITSLFNSIDFISKLNNFCQNVFLRSEICIPAGFWNKPRICWRTYYFAVGKNSAFYYFLFIFIHYESNVMKTLHRKHFLLELFQYRKTKSPFQPGILDLHLFIDNILHVSWLQ